MTEPVTFTTPTPADAYGCTGPTGVRTTRLPMKVVTLASTSMLAMSRFSRPPREMREASNSMPSSPPKVTAAPNVPLLVSLMRVAPAKAVARKSAEAGAGASTAARAAVATTVRMRWCVYRIVLL